MKIGQLSRREQTQRPRRPLTFSFALGSLAGMDQIVYAVQADNVGTGRNSRNPVQLRLDRVVVILTQVPYLPKR